MPNKYVQSNFTREKDDHYPTIDKRCIIGFLENFKPNDLCIDVCSPNGSGIVDTLKEYSYQVECLDDAFKDNIKCEWIITNPPYKRKLVDDIINRQILRLENNEIDGLAILLRSNFAFAKSRKLMFENKFYFGEIKLRFRPIWKEPIDGEKKIEPIHNFVWHIWRIGNGVPRIMYGNGYFGE